MGRKGSVFVPFVQTGCAKEKYGSYLVFKPQTTNICVLTLPRKTQRLPRGCQFFLRDWCALKKRKYRFVKDYTSVKQDIYAIVRKSDYVQMITCSESKLTFKILSNEEIQEKKLCKKLKKIKKEDYNPPSVGSSSGYGSGVDSPGSSDSGRDNAILLAIEHDHDFGYPNQSSLMEVDSMDDSDFSNPENTQTEFDSDVASPSAIPIENLPGSTDNNAVLENLDPAGVTLDNMIQCFEKLIFQMEAGNFSLDDEFMEGVQEALRKLAVAPEELETNEQVVVAPAKTCKVYEFEESKFIGSMLMLKFVPKVLECREDWATHKDGTLPILLDDMVKDALQSLTVKNVEMVNDHVLMFLDHKST